MSDARSARCYLRAHRHGTLATISQRLSGYPFGSVVPFALDHGARPIFLVSRLAEHTKNMEVDARTSLLVHNDETDIQAASRLTLIGDATPVEPGCDTVRARYLRFFPDAKRLLELGDFAFYRMEPVELRLIGGFGSIHWISAVSYAPPASELNRHEAAILDHMNADHTQCLRDYCAHFKRKRFSTATMVGIDCDGFDLRTDGEWLRFDFAQAVIDLASARAALVDMAREARAQ
jgi:heme iron utilization protein